MTFFRWQQVLAALKSEAQVSQYAKHENKNDRLPFKYLGFLDAAFDLQSGRFYNEVISVDFVLKSI